MRSELAAKLGAKLLALLERSGRLVFADGPSRPGAQGMHLNGVVTLYPQNIKPGEAWGVFLHEAGGHAGLERMLGGNYRRVVEAFNRLLASGNPYAVEADRRQQAAGTPEQHVGSERLAYLTEDVTNNPNREGYGAARLLVGRIVAAVRAWALVALPSWAQPRNLTPADIQALAVRAARYWVDGGTVAAQADNAQQATENKATTGRQENGGQPMFSQTISDDLDWLDHGEPVATMRGDEVPVFGKVGELARWVADFWGLKHGNEVVNPLLGAIRLNKRAALDSIGHGIGRDKAQAFFLVPDALANGHVLGSLPAVDGKPKAYIVAAPIGIGDKTFRLLMEVRQDANGSRLYVHEVVVREFAAAPAFNSSAASQEGAGPQGAKRGAIFNFMRGLRERQADNGAQKQGNMGTSEGARPENGKNDGAQFSVADDGADEATPNAWDDVPMGAPAKGMDRAGELGRKAWAWARDNALEVVKTGGLGALTLRQLAEVGEKVVPSARGYMDRVERMMTDTNQMLDASAKLGRRWAALDGLVKKRLAWLMHRATLEGVDPSLVGVPDAEISIVVADPVWREKLGMPERDIFAVAEREALKVDAKVLRLLRKRYLEARNRAVRSKGRRESYEGLKQVAKRLEDDWRAARNALARREKAVGKFDALAAKFAALPEEARDIFTEARDMYEARFKRKHEALVRAIERSEMPDGKKKAVLAELQHEFESARVQGIYFPLHRQGDYFVRASLARDDLENGVTTYAKDTSRVKLEAHVNKDTGESWWQVAKDGRKFGTEAEALAAAGQWETEALAMASANTRADLVGKRLVAVQQGDGWVLQDDPNEPVFMMFATAGEAMRTAAALRGDSRYSGVGTGKINKNKTQDEMAQVGALTGLMGKMGKDGLEVPDEVYQMLLEMLPELSMRKNAIHRKGVMGYADDALQAFGYQMSHQARQIAKLEARDDLKGLLDKVAEESTEAVGDSDRLLAGSVREELKLRHDWVMSPTNAPWTNWTSSFGFFMYLGVSPAAALVNLSQVAVVGYPVLAAKFGWKGAADALLDAVRLLSVKEALAGEDALSRDGMGEDELEAFRQWHEDGVIDKSQAQMLAGIGDNDSIQNSPTYQKWMGRTAHLFHKAEVVNREVMLLAGYRLGRKSGMGHEEAVKYARDATWESQFDYANANRARVMQGDMAKLFLMFKSYSQHMIYFLLRNAHQWGKGGEDAKAAKVKLLGILGMTLAMGGVSALPIGLVGATTAFTYANARYGTQNAILGTGGAAVALMVLAALVLDDEEDWEAEVRKWLRGVGGEWLETLVFGGAVNAATGVDLSSRISLDDLLVRSSDRDLDGDSAKLQFSEAMMGPVVGYAANLVFDVPKLWGDGHEWRAVEKAMPKFAKDYLKVMRFGSEGVLNLRGDAVVGSKLSAMPWDGEYGLWDAFWQGMGFGSSKVSRQDRENTDIKNYEGRVFGRKTRILGRYYLAWMEGDGAAMQEAVDDAMAWNREHPDADPIRGKDLKNAIKSRVRRSQSSLHGVYMAKSRRFIADGLNVD